jgi:putative aldouronate transport system permease protein
MYGVLLAFKEFNFAKGIWGSPWIGFSNFKYLFGLSDFWLVFKNSIYLSLLKIIFGFPFPIMLAVMLGEVANMKFKKTMQTLIYLPHFISWVVIGGIMINFLSPTWGVVNSILKNLGHDPIYFLAENKWFAPIVVITSIWKEAGWGTIIYLAAITGINTELYEAAVTDGCNRFQKIWNITLPSIRSTIVLLLILRLGSIMSNGFEQIFTLQNPKNLVVSEVFETYVYRMGIVGGRFSFGTAVGLFTSLIGLVFLLASDRFAKMLGEEGIW